MSRVIAIGALGGSGTRAVAQILIEAGIHLGDLLNSANDNLVFTRLFKDPAFRERATPGEIRQRLSLFRQYMESGRLSPIEALELVRASMRNPTIGTGRRFLGRLTARLLAPERPRETWGWKEPNTQIYLAEIDDFFPDLKYLHVVRHGLDMALSRNKSQLFNWGHLYGIHARPDMPQDELAYWQLEYWVRSTRDVLEKSRRMRGDFLLVNHSLLGEEPEEQVRRMLEFLELELPDEKVRALAEIPRVPPTSGRYRNQDPAIFDRAQIDFVRELGFEV